MMPQRFLTGSRVDEQAGLNNPLPTTVAAFAGLARKRVGHGSVAWSASSAEDALCQPQDGAAEGRDLRRHMAETAGVQAIHARRLANEPEDARLTGGTRSLMRRLMGLNVTARPSARRAPRNAKTVPAQQVA
jgi:hypothetical protein